MNQTKTEYLTCDNPECPNFGYNLLWTDPEEWEQCCEKITTLYDQALDKSGYDPAEFYRKTYAELDELYQDNDAPETVQLIASGYKWFCAPCDHTNKVIEITEIVTCEICGRDYRTDDDTLHAYG